MMFSAISVLYHYGSVVSLDNTYIYLHVLSRLVGTNCPRKWRFDLNESTANLAIAHFTKIHRTRQSQSR